MKRAPLATVTIKLSTWADVQDYQVYKNIVSDFEASQNEIKVIPEEWVLATIMPNYRQCSPPALFLTLCISNHGRGKPSRSMAFCGRWMTSSSATARIFRTSEAPSV